MTAITANDTVIVHEDWWKFVFLPSCCPRFVIKFLLTILGLNSHKCVSLTVSKQVCNCGIRGGSTFPLPIIALVIGGLALSGCSSSFSRFSFPVFGLTGSNNPSDQTGTVPRAPVYESTPDYTPAPPGASRYDGYNGYRDRTSSRYEPSLGRSTSISRAPLPPAPRPTGGITRYRVAAVNPNRLDPAPYAPVREPSYVTPSYVTDESAAAARVITVRPGDTLYGLARRHNVTVGALRSANGLTGNGLRIGQTLRVPASFVTRVPERTASYSPVGSRPSYTPPVVSKPQAAPVASWPQGDKSLAYRVRRGETLYSISRKFGLKAEAVGNANSITDPGALKVGQILMIPGAAGGAGRASANSRVAAAQRRMPTVKMVKTRRVPLPSAVPPVPKKKVASLKKLPAPPRRSSSRFRWPVRGRIISRFGAKSSGLHNDGVNVAVPLGTSIKAAENGVVVYAGNELKGYGKLVLIRHSDNWVSAYAHNSKIVVKRGEKIKRGQIVAKAGKTGMVNQPQLHFELRKGSKPVDPLKYMTGS